MNNAPDPSGLPLFFKNPQVINLERHAKAKLKSGMTMRFASPTNAIPLNASDVSESALCYPVVFSMDAKPVPLAIVGLEKDNYFIDEKGQWEPSAYVPSYVKRYPFVFLQAPDEDRLTLCIEEDVLDLNGEGEGTALYDGETPSAFVNNALEFCAAYHEQFLYTQGLGEWLAKLDVLMPSQSTIELPDGRETVLDGFQMVDPKKMQALSDAQLLEGFRSGHIAALFYSLQSQANWGRLLDRAASRG